MSLKEVSASPRVAQPKLKLICIFIETWRGQFVHFPFNLAEPDRMCWKERKRNWHKVKRTGRYSGNKKNNLLSNFCVNLHQQLNTKTHKTRSKVIRRSCYYQWPQTVQRRLEGSTVFHWQYSYSQCRQIAITQTNTRKKVCVPWCPAERSADDPQTRVQSCWTADFFHLSCFASHQSAPRTAPTHLLLLKSQEYWLSQPSWFTNKCIYE